ncbi:toxin-antitoxin system YwqK family antitoxin [Fibrella sp. WM1]|uniref:toxin-antitoxin system YwqK family antitoxin n=1 Tax=Fibrella musci TaxID=3242485 RepID=UPI00351F8A26
MNGTHSQAEKKREKKKKNSQYMNVVSSKQTDRDDNGYIYHRGELFTGIEEWHYDTGELGTTTEYVSGIPNGFERGWYKNGAKRSEKQYVAGSVQGIVRKWHENGQLQLEKEVKNGKQMWIKQWDETGRLIVDSKSTSI